MKKPKTYFAQLPLKLVSEKIARREVALFTEASAQSEPKKQQSVVEDGGKRSMKR